MAYIIITTQIIIIYLLITTLANLKCSNESPPEVPKYYLLEKCHRSKQGIAAVANYTSLSSCQRFGIERKALALNFSPPEARAHGEELEYTCEALKCAESDGGLSLVNDSRYDYYSIYAKPLPDVNSTCLPATGMFYLVQKRLDYTEAQEQCKNRIGVLADVTSDQRTDSLANLLSGASVSAAYVALRSYNGSSFYSSNGDSLACTTYRAWAPGHPRRYRLNYDCVVVTRHRTWRSTPCKRKYPALCEILPSGPYKRGSIFASRKHNDTMTPFSETMSNDNKV